jgi:hypothetical protein
MMAGGGEREWADGDSFWRCHGLPQSQAARRKPDARRSGPADTIYGDAGANLLDGAVGGDDTLTTYGAGNVYGDAGKNIVGYARGGNDGVAAFIVAATAFPVTVNLFGDAGGAISGFAQGGRDVLNATISDDYFGVVNVNMYGDAGGAMSGFARGGNDALSIAIVDSGRVYAHLYGDAGGNLSGYAVGGNDTLSAPGSLFGANMPPIDTATPAETCRATRSAAPTYSRRRAASAT